MLAAAGTSASHAEATSRLVGRQCARRSLHKDRGKRESSLVNLAYDETACVGNVCALTVPCAGRSSVVKHPRHLVVEKSHCLPM